MILSSFTEPPTTPTVNLEHLVTLEMLETLYLYPASPYLSIPLSSQPLTTTNARSISIGFPIMDFLTNGIHFLLPLSFPPTLFFLLLPPATPPPPGCLPSLWT